MSSLLLRRSNSGQIDLPMLMSPTHFFDNEPGGSLDIQDIARSIRYTADLVGVEHVGIGSDFDGAVRTPIDASEMSQITEALLREGFSYSEIKLVMVENFLKLLGSILK